MGKKSMFPLKRILVNTNPILVTQQSWKNRSKIVVAINLESIFALIITLYEAA